MSRTIAFCTAAIVFQNNQILNEDVAKSFPGALWVTRLAQFAAEAEINVLTGDVAISRVQAGQLKPSEILVIQEESCALGFQLLSFGAKPFLLISAESPVYASSFYKQISEISSLFKNRLLFRGAFPDSGTYGSNHILYFPSFSQEVTNAPTKWEDRRFLVMVAANKYWKPVRSLPRFVLASLRDMIMGRKSYITNDAKELQLHDKRLEVIEYFGQRDSLDLFGSNWNDIRNLPVFWRARLLPILLKLNPTQCSDKFSVIANYKFAICFENMTYPGYVTEKIIDCFRMGVIPIYLGAPDISDFIPKGTFIDFRDYSDLGELYSFLQLIKEDTAMYMIDSARSFLKTADGLKYSFEGFAKNVLGMVEEYD